MPDHTLHCNRRAKFGVFRDAINDIKFSGSWMNGDPNGTYSSLRAIFRYAGAGVSTVAVALDTPGKVGLGLYACHVCSVQFSATTFEMSWRRAS